MSAELRLQVRASLPANVLALMDEIETYAGLEIDVEIATPHNTGTIADMPAAGLSVGAGDAIVLLRDAANPNPQAICHELLHLRRHWIDLVPSLTLSDGGNPALGYHLARINETLAHLVVVPREGEYGFDLAYWSDVARRHWEAYPWPTVVDPFLRREDCLLHRLSLNYVADAAVVARGRACLQEEGMLDLADRFDARVKQLLPLSPGRALAAALRFLEIPRQQAQLAYLDQRRGEIRYAPVPLN